MPSWLIKAGLQGIMSLMPFSEELNYIFQRHVTRGLRLSDAFFEEKLAISKRHIHNFQHVTGDQDKLPNTVLELGSGWQPIVPIALSLCGIDHMVSVDIKD